MLITSTAAAIARTLGLVAAGLAAIGLTGVLIWMVQMRRSEIGLRVALGATASDVRWLVVSQAWRATWPGVLAGLVGALLAAWALRSQWYGVQPLDPVVLTIVPATQLVIVFLASWVPASRAARISALELMR